MEQIGYGQYIAEHILRLPFGVPIYTEDMARELADQFEIEMGKAKSLVNVNLKRIADSSGLEHYQKGIYYRAQTTPFGKTKLNPARVTHDMYLDKDGMTIGYETGASFCNRIGLTTQLPRYKFYATNTFRQNGSRVEDKLGVVLRKPVTTVTEENHRYLQLLDVVENKDKVSVDALNPEKIILEYIRSNQLDFAKLAGYASKYYRKEVLLRIGEIAAVQLT